ncbi:triose-phosphate isomerase [Silvibacterium acidisoli]|uniref:triose-phosphate isomerase n=1 Tax=Acidobacteriaceae bacterium ZG23-2 TaxID=2883246 RepID=UPI00406C3B6A
MARKPLIAANWKMYKTPAQAQEFVTAFLPLVANHDRDEIILFPSTTSLSVVVAAASGSNVAVGGQNMYFTDEGAFTGETSPVMLKAVGVTHVLVGHSERRHYFCESDEIVDKKLHAAFRHGLKPIVCIGETLEQHEKGQTHDVCLRQIRDGLKDVTAEMAKTLVVAYEPLWAIGTGQSATPEAASEVHAIIRDDIARMIDEETAINTRILYGGSVKPDNIDALMVKPDIDGVLVGGASLDPQSFARIVKYC